MVSKVYMYTMAVDIKSVCSGWEEDPSSKGQAFDSHHWAVLQTGIAS